MQFSTKDLLVTVLPRHIDPNLQTAKCCLLRSMIGTFQSLCQHRTCLYAYGGSILCGRCSFQITCGICSHLGSGGCQFFASCGGPGGSACDPTYFCAGPSTDPWVIKDLEELVTLKSELQQTLKQLDEIEKDLPSGIRSKADAEMLERNLTEALDQVRKAKDKLK